MHIPNAALDEAAQIRRERLLVLMREHGLTCRELGRLLDRHAGTVGNWRAGRWPIPDHTAALLELAEKTGHLQEAKQ